MRGVFHRIADDHCRSLADRQRIEQRARTEPDLSADDREGAGRVDVVDRSVGAGDGRRAGTDEGLLIERIGIGVVGENVERLDLVLADDIGVRVGDGRRVVAVEGDRSRRRSNAEGAGAVRGTVNREVGGAADLTRGFVPGVVGEGGNRDAGRREADVVVGVEQKRGAVARDERIPDGPIGRPLPAADAAGRGDRDALRRVVIDIGDAREERRHLLAGLQAVGERNGIGLDFRGVVGAVNGDGDRLRVRARAIRTNRVVIEGYRGGLAGGELLIGLGRVEDVGAVGLEIEVGACRRIEPVMDPAGGARSRDGSLVGQVLVGIDRVVRGDRWGRRSEGHVEVNRLALLDGHAVQPDHDVVGIGAQAETRGGRGPDYDGLQRDEISAQVDDLERGEGHAGEIMVREKGDRQPGLADVEREEAFRIVDVGKLGCIGRRIDVNRRRYVRDLRIGGVVSNRQIGVAEAAIAHVTTFTATRHPPPALRLLHLPAPR